MAGYLNAAAVGMIFLSFEAAVMFTFNGRREIRLVHSKTEHVVSRADAIRAKPGDSTAAAEGLVRSGMFVGTREERKRCVGVSQYARFYNDLRDDWSIICISGQSHTRPWDWCLLKNECSCLCSAGGEGSGHP